MTDLQKVLGEQFVCEFIDKMQKNPTNNISEIERIAKKALYSNGETLFKNYVSFTFSLSHLTGLALSGPASSIFWLIMNSVSFILDLPASSEKIGKFIHEKIFKNEPLDNPENIRTETQRSA